MKKPKTFFRSQSNVLFARDKKKSRHRNKHSGRSNSIHGGEMPKMQKNIADAIMIFTNYDTENDGALTLDQLRHAMSKEKLDIDMDSIFGELANSEGKISMQQFVMGLHKCYGEKTMVKYASAPNKKTPMIHSPQTWAKVTVYKGLQNRAMTRKNLFDVIKEEDIDDDSDDDSDEDDEEARSLASALFKIMDVGENGILTMDVVRAGLEEVDPDIFSGEILDEVMEQLDDTHTATVSEHEFTVCFAALAATSLEDMRKNIDKYKKKKQEEEDDLPEALTLAVSNSYISNPVSVVGFGKQEMDERWGNSFDVVSSRTRLLEQQLRLAKADAEKIKKRYELVKKENSIAQARSEKLMMENKKLHEKPKENDTISNEKLSMCVSETQYKQMMDGFEQRIKKMKKELEEADKSKKIVEERLSTRRPSLVKRLEKALSEKEDKLQKTTRSLSDYRKASKQAQSRQKKTETKLKRLRQISVTVQQLQEEKNRLEEVNEKLQETLLRTREESIDPTPAEIPLTVHRTSTRPRPQSLSGNLNREIGELLLDNEEFANMEKKLKDMETKLTNKNQELKEKDRELENMKKEVQKKEQQLKKKDQDLENLRKELKSANMEVKSGEKKSSNMSLYEICCCCTFWVGKRPESRATVLPIGIAVKVTPSPSPRPSPKSNNLRVPL